MAPSRIGLGDLEREVMRQLWAATGPMTVRQVHEALSRRRDLAYTTVMTVLDRLTKKGVVTREKADRAYLYAATQTREEATALAVCRGATRAGHISRQPSSLLAFRRRNLS